MYYQTKFKYTVELPNGKQRKKSSSLLIDAETFGEAEASTYAFSEQQAVKDFEVTSVMRSPIREVANPHFYNEDSDAWIVTLEDIFLTDDGKEKKLRYPVLFWSSEMPNATDKMVKDYCMQVDESGTMKVVAVKKSDIVQEL